MSPQISQEGLLIVMSLYGGLVLAVCYDMVRVCRRIFKVGIVSMIIQDVIYWTRHTPKALFFALLLNSRRKSERFHFGTLLLNFLRKFNHFRTSLPASPTSPDILSGKSHIPSEMPGKKRNNPEIQTPGRRS